MTGRRRRDGRPGRLGKALRRGVAWLGVVWVLAACGDDGPEAGEIRVVVSEETALGGAVVELSGEGLLGVRGAPGTTVLARPVANPGAKALPRLRVVAIQDTPGPLTLVVEVADRSAPLVGATLVEASDADDRLLPPFLLPEIQVLR